MGSELLVLEAATMRQSEGRHERQLTECFRT